MKFNHLILLVLFSVFFTSCGSKKNATTKSGSKEETVTQSRNHRETPGAKSNLPSRNYTDVVDEYIETFADIAMDEMRLYKIPASITLAQGILESGAGRGDLTRRANNHFGIKCHDWKGDKVYHDDDLSQECFRKYNDPKYSYRDHSLFLSERRRYAGLFDLKIDDYKAWAKGLRAAGYATDRLYPNKLIDLIERYQLYNYDAVVLGKQPATIRVTSVKKSNGRIHNVQKGDTLYSIARKYNTSVEQLQRINNIKGNTISIGQVLVLEP